MTDRKNKRIFFIRIAGVVAVAFLIMTYINQVFILKQQHYYAINSDVTDLPYYSEKWEGFYEKDKDSVDAIFFGTSVTHTDIDVNLMYHNHGFTSYLLSADQMRGGRILSFLKEAMKYQTPEIVFIDVQAMSHAINSGEESAHYSFDFMRNGVERVEGIATLKDISYEEILFPFTKYHSRWEELCQEDFDFVLMDKTNLLNGHMLYMWETADNINNSPPVMYEKSDFTLEELGYQETVEWLDRIVSYCREKDMECVLYRTPNNFTYVQSKYNNAMDAYAREKGIKYWNFNDCLNEIGVDFSADFVDGQHMNQTGAERFSAFLGQQIADSFELPDHRGEDGYKEWDEAYEYQQYLIHDFEIRHYMTAQEYADNNDFMSDNLIFVYTYDSLSDLKSVSGVPSAVNQLSDVKKKSNTCILYKNSITDEINLPLGGTWSEKEKYPVNIYIEALDSGTKVWCNDEYIEAQYAAGVVNLMIYDIKLAKVLDYVAINVNGESNLTHLWNPYG